jgi:D-serine deaminase-like pyridoxal phosphate-dependent protein
VGDRVLLTPGYTPTTVNLHDVLFAIDDGTVIDVWRVLARGSLPLA